MITKWKVSNFKSIREETELDFRPLTIFAGANSSGKSTFIQSILLVAQTLVHKVGSRSVVLNDALTSLGQFDDLKSNDSSLDRVTIKCTCWPSRDQDAAIDQQSQFTSHDPIYWHLCDQFHEVACEISFGADASSSQHDLLQIQPQLFATRLSCISRDEDDVEQKADISIDWNPAKTISKVDGVDSVSEIGGQLRASLDYDVGLDDDSMDEVKEDFHSAKPAGCIFRHFLPERLICEIDNIKEDANAITMSLQYFGRHFGRRPIGLLRRNKGRDIFLSQEVIAVLRGVLISVLSEVFEGTINPNQGFKDKDWQESLFGSETYALTFRSWNERLHERLRRLPHNKRLKVRHAMHEREDLFDRIYEAMKATPANKSETHDFVQVEPPNLITEATRYLNHFFALSLKYLGPLRDAPKPLYPLTPAANPHDVGLRGEYTASILELRKKEEICYIPSANFKNPVIGRETVIQPLEEAVIDWLQYLGVANSVESQDKGKFGYELKVKISNLDSSHDLTHVGVGVSQVLPILVMCLLANTDSTLVFEQPELHLHPKVQTLLGDFFLSMALCNKQCIVETHSEYLIDRIRYRIAAASPEEELKSQTKIYFVEKPSQVSTFREVVVNEYGAVLNWPEGFFDQSQKQAEEILRAASMKRKASRKNKDA